MNQNPAITDDPLPDGQLVDKAVEPAGSEVAVSSPAPDEHHGTSLIDHVHEALPEPHLHAENTGYGHSDPASLAAVSTLELHEPELHQVQGQQLEAPIWDPATDTAVAASVDSTSDIPPSLSQQPSILAHLAQVGLTSSDQWEEQIQPRIQKLNDDIAQVHVQLDDLERNKPKKYF